MYWKALATGLLSALSIFASENQQPSSKTETKAPPAQPARAGLNGAAALRNENVQVNRIDTDAVKEANIRLGTNVTILTRAPVEASYYSAEHGRPPGELPVLRPAPTLNGWHGELFAFHQNSVLNARTFFQVGPVQPSRQNFYGARFTGHTLLGDLTGSFMQRKVRGMVNGNVLVPLASERTPLATAPALRAIVSSFLNAYPRVAPNRPDFDPRALNTNAPQRIDEIDNSLRLDRQLTAQSRISASQTLARQRIDAFQFVAGQNPDTEIHTHRSRLTWRYVPSGNTELALGGGFTRVKSVLAPEPNAVGPRVRIGYQVEELGPDSHFPIDRAQNMYRLGAAGSHRYSSHTFTFGGDLFRTQVNGVETNNSRGVVWFTNNFGHTALENMRLGLPSMYEATLGGMHRGYRNWAADFFWADQWQVSPRLQVYYGVRYGFETAPREVNNLDTFPYGCDCNNFGPRFSVAYRGPREWVLRAGYTASFGQIFPVTYGQQRYNLPNARYVQVQNPDLVDPLRGLDLQHGRTSPTLLSPDLVAPYSHQYGLSVERRFANRYLVRAGYVGSRSFKLLDLFVFNRAVNVPGIPLTTQTIDERRPDPRYYEVKHVVNTGIAYLDAAQLALEVPYRSGLTWGAAYTFGKAIDAGSDYSGTAANRDASSGRAQSQFESFWDKKGLSKFDAPHSLMLWGSYDLPRVASTHGAAGWLLNGWQLSASSLLKSGTPLTLYIGSDGPGFGNVDGGPSERPNILDASILGLTVGDPNTAPHIMSRDRFAYIPVGQLRGNVGRGTFRKSPIHNLNAALAKQWRWRGRSERAVWLRGEAFNLTNTPQFDEPQRNLSSPAFGKITNTLNDGRVLQLGLRLVL
jgi:hypothetical protein